MNNFFNFCLHFGGGGPEVLKCHEYLIILDTYVQQGKIMDKKFYIQYNLPNQDT